MRKLASTLCSGVLSAVLSAGLLAVPAHASGDHMKEVLDRGTIRIGVLGALKPWAYRSEDGNMQGFDIDLASRIAESLGVDLELVEVTSVNRMEFLQQGRVDMLLAGMYDKAERRKIIGIVEPAYGASGPSLMAKKGLISSWDDIKGKPVCAKQGVIYNSIAETEFGATVVAFTGNAEAKEGLRSGKCVAWFYDDTIILPELASGEWDDYEMPVEALNSNPIGAAVAIEEQDGALGVFLSGMIYRWHSDGTFLELEEKWKVGPSSWYAKEHEKLHWDTSYLVSE